MKNLVNEIVVQPRPIEPPLSMAYCDYIAHTLVRPSLLNDSDTHSEYPLITEVGMVSMDLHTDGYMLSTRKTILCKDHNGKEYRIVIEEV